MLHLLRIGESFQEEAFAALAALNPLPAPRALGAELFACTLVEENLPQVRANPFVRYLLPVAHQWPTDPSSTGFVERAAQGIAAKLSSSAAPEGVRVFSTVPGLRRVAVGLRGRLAQLCVGSGEEQTVRLHVIVTPRGVWAGCGRTAELLHDNAAAFLPLSSKGAPSRAYAKLEEALQLVAVLEGRAPQLAHWLELGAAPGGMTKVLAERGWRVTAIDRAPLAPEVAALAGVQFHLGDARHLSLGGDCDALLCDLNGSFENALALSTRCARRLLPGALVIHTIKIAADEAPITSAIAVRAAFAAEGVEVLAIKHLPHNRRELTFIGRRR